MAVEKAEFQLTLDQRPFQASMNKARQSTVGLTEATNKAGASIGAAATSVSGLNTALGGATNTTNNLIGAAGNLATTFAAAGTLGLALAAGTTAIGLLVGEMEKQKKAAEEAEKAAKKLAKAYTDDLKKSAEEAAGALRTLTNQMDPRSDLGKAIEAEIKAEKELAKATGIQVKAREALLGAMAREGELLLEMDRIKKQGVGGDAARLNQIRSELRDMPKLLEKRKEALRIAREGVRASEKALRDRSEASKRLSKQEQLPLLGVVTDPVATGGPSGKPKGGGGGGGGGEPFSISPLAGTPGSMFDPLGLGTPISAIKEQQKARDDFVRQSAEAQQRDTEARRAQLADRIEAERAAAEEIAEINQNLTDRMNEQAQRRMDAGMQLLGDSISVMQSMTSSGISLLQDSIDMLIEGEEKAAEKILTAFLKMVGGQLVAFGTRASFEGAFKLVDPVTAPIGALQLGIGLSAIGTGIAMGAAGTGVAHVAAGGAIGQALPDAPGSSPTAGSRQGIANPNGGSGGGLTVNISYGVGGPNKEDAERAVMDAFREAQRKGF